MFIRLSAILLCVGFGCCVAGCSEQDPDDVAAATISNTELSDVQAIEELAKQVFPSREDITVDELDSGEISLTVTVHPSEVAEVRTFAEGGLSAAELDAGYVLGTTVFKGRRMVEYGRQRKLGELTVRVRHTVLDETGTEVTVDIFGYTLPKAAFDDFLNVGSAMDIAAGKALTTIEKTCVIDYNNFDQISYTPKNE